MTDKRDGAIEMNNEVPDVSAEQVKAAIEAAKRKFWKVHNCSMCGYPCGYHFRECGVVEYDSGCDCVRYGPEITLRDYEDVAHQINMQNDEWRAKLLAEISAPEAR